MTTKPINEQSFDPKAEKWGFLRETKEDAIKSGIDADTGLHRNGLDEYLAVIFPDVTDWVHDKTIPNLPEGIKCRKRPDYRSETLKLIIEFDGVQHFESPEQIRKDIETTKLYESFGYRVVRIPFFIQLTNTDVKEIFNVNVEEPLFNPKIPSMGITGTNPGRLCMAGVQRMAQMFICHPEQYLTNINYLKSFDDDYLTGVSLLEAEYDAIFEDVHNTCESIVQ
jgi:hypothetical protein